MPIERKRLLGLIESTSDHWLVEACAGSGKSQLATQLARTASTQLIRYRPTMTSSVFMLDEHATSLVIDIGSALDLTDPATDTDLARLVQTLESQVRIILLARSLGSDTRAVVNEMHVRTLTSQELWFSEDELKDLVDAYPTVPSAVTASLFDACAGWPYVAAQAVDDSTSLPDVRRRAEALIESVVERARDQLTPARRDALDAFAFLQEIDESTGTIIADAGFIDALLAAGIPVQQSMVGWWKIADSTAQLIKRRCEPFPEIPLQAYRTLANHGRAFSAIECALAVGDRDVAAELFAQLRIDEVSTAEPGRIDAAISMIGDSIDAHPRGKLVHAWRFLVRGELSSVITTLEAALSEREALAPHPGLRGEFRAEIAAAKYFAGDIDGARSVIDDIDQSSLSPPARARLREVQAGVKALRMTPDALDEALELYREAADLWQAAGQLRSARRTLVSMSLEVVARRGLLVEALHLLRQAGQASSSLSDVAQDSVFQARILVLLGDEQQAIEALEMAEQRGATLQLSWVAGFAHAWRAILASQQQDVVALRHHAEAGIAALGDVMKYASGALVHADFVAAFARVGDQAQSADHLAYLRDHDSAEASDLAFAECLFACRVGDAASGLELIQQFRQSGLAVPFGEWRLDHLEAVAHQRLGNESQAGRHITQAQAHARAVHTPNIIDATETQPVVASRAHLQGQEAAGPSTPIDDPDHRHRFDMGPSATQPVHVTILHTFSVEENGVPASIGSGHPQTLLKLLVLAGGQTSVDTAIDALWPNATLDVGKRRLRNVLTRLRGACGPIVQREGEALRLDQDLVLSDFGQWTHRCSVVLASAAPKLDELRTLTDAAPDLLLLGDQYEEWLHPHQRRYQLDLLRLLDLMVRVCVDAGDIDGAIAAYVRCLEIEPDRAERIDAAVELLRSDGRMAAAADFENSWRRAD